MERLKDTVAQVVISILDVPAMIVMSILSVGYGLYIPFLFLSAFLDALATIYRKLAWPLAMLRFIGGYEQVPDPDDPPKEQVETLKQAKTYQEWLSIARELDQFVHHHKPSNSCTKREREMIHFIGFHPRHVGRMESDVDLDHGLCESGPIGREDIDAPPEAFAKSYLGENNIIRGYVHREVGRISRYIQRPCEDQAAVDSKATSLDSQGILHGWSVLILQGGGVFALHHVGIARALLEQRLLPRLIFGSSTGAWIAAMLATMSDEEFFGAIDGLLKHVLGALQNGGQALEQRIDWTTLMNTRKPGFRSQEYDENKDIFAEYVENLIGPTTTFQEAYDRTGRTVSIEIACDIPASYNLLNYINTPNIIIATAARAAQEDDYDLAPDCIWEKSDYDGEIHTWSLNDETPSFRAVREKYRILRGTAHRHISTWKYDPIRRHSQIFRTNHHIISQPRPYIFPFLRTAYYNRAQRPKYFAATQAWIARALVLQWRIRMHQLGRFADIPFKMQQLMMDDRTPGLNTYLAPDATWEEVEKLVFSPTKEALERCVLAGERTVWEVLPLLHVRRDIELALEPYQLRLHPI